MSNLYSDKFFTELWHNNYTVLWKHAYYQLYNRNMADDAVSETFTRALKYMNRGHPKPGAWLMLTLNNYCLELNIKEMRQRNITYPPPSEPDPGIGELLPSALCDHDAELLTLFYVEHRSLAEIAAMHQITYSVCKLRLHRARKRLRHFLEEGER